MTSCDLRGNAVPNELVPRFPPFAPYPKRGTKDITNLNQINQQEKRATLNEIMFFVIWGIPL
jgi:hypothetical protein